MQVTFVGKTVLLGNLIRYYLVSECSGERASSFGVLVRYRDEQVVLSDISPHRGEMQHLLCRMLRGAVTPVAVPDVVEDWLLK